MAAALTRQLGSFIADLAFDAIPEDAIATVKTGMIDCIGVMVAGCREPNVAIVDRCFRHIPEAPESRLFLTGERVSAPLAALVNGVAAHVLDYDDVAEPLGGHPSTVLAPAILAEADALPGVKGRDMVRAYVTGYEAWAELAGRDRHPHHMKGWHPTSAFGVIGAAAACAALRGLGAEQATHALGIAASEAGGLVANFGSMTKSLHAGRAAQAGVLACRLAAAGFTAAPDALEHPRGLLAALSPHGEMDVASPVEWPRREWRISIYRLGVKKYPMCYAVHRALDGVLDLVRAHPVAPDDVEQIDVLLGEKQAAILRNHRPQTGLEAKFSIEFAMAAALAAGRVGLAELSDPFVLRDDVQRLMARVRVEPMAESGGGESVFSPFDQVRLRLKDGRILAGARVEVARGDRIQPLSREELWIKFEDCLAYGRHGSDAARKLFDALDRLEEVDSAAALPSLRSQSTRANGGQQNERYS